jgi:DNA replication and repair protein RecF
MKSLRIQNFRSHSDFSLDLKNGVTLITGLNSTGKTSIVEAIFIALQGKSWRSNFSEIIKYNQNWWRIDLEIDNEKRIVKYSDSQKTFEINGKQTKTLPKKFRKQVILFEPEDTRILYGSPKRRRDFIDRFISEIDDEYMDILRKYNRSLVQRNRLLKSKNFKESDLLVWDVNIANFGAKIIKKRSDWVAEVNQDLSREYQKIRRSKDEVKLVYKNHDTTQKILAKLKEGAPRDRILGHTTVGPHKDDIYFIFNGAPADKKVSRGEGKLILLTIFIILIKKYNIRYVIFDDLFNEIDIKKIKKIERALSGIKNVFITDCRLLDEDFGYKVNLSL